MKVWYYKVLTQKLRQNSHLCQMSIGVNRVIRRSNLHNKKMEESSKTETLNLYREGKQECEVDCTDISTNHSTDSEIDKSTANKIK